VILRRWIAGAVTVGGAAQLAHAQAVDEAQALERARSLVAQVEATDGCDLALHGAPVLDDLTGRWLIAYSGVGAACDDAGAALQREGVQAQITFFRRPSPDEIMQVIGQMRASVRNGYPCLIVFNGEPRFDEDSNLWTVRYSASGQQCGDAGEELERQGKTLRVAFYRAR